MNNLFNNLNMDKTIFSKIEYINQKFPNQSEEIDDEGNREYKWKISIEDEKEKDNKINKLASQMKFRLYEGNGKALYIIGLTNEGDAVGITENDLYNTLCIIDEVAIKINSDILGIKIYNNNNYYICTIRIYKNECEFNI